MLCAKLDDPSRLYAYGNGSQAFQTGLAAFLRLRPMLENHSRPVMRGVSAPVLTQCYSRILAWMTFLYEKAVATQDIIIASVCLKTDLSWLIFAFMSNESTAERAFRDLELLRLLARLWLLEDDIPIANAAILGSFTHSDALSSVLCLLVEEAGDDADRVATLLHQRIERYSKSPVDLTELSRLLLILRVFIDMRDQDCLAPNVLVSGGAKTFTRALLMISQSPRVTGVSTREITDSLVIILCRFLQPGEGLSAQYLLQAIRAKLLHALVACSPDLKSFSNEGFQAAKQLISRVLPLGLVYASVVGMCTASLMNMTEKEIDSIRKSLLGSEWAIFEALLLERVASVMWKNFCTSSEYVCLSVRLLHSKH